MKQAPFYSAAKVRISEQNTKGKAKFFFLFSSESTFDVCQIYDKKMKPQRKAQVIAKRHV